MIDEGDIPSIQCKMGLRGPTSMRKVDDMCLIFIDFYVPALTPRLNSTETSLQLLTNFSRWHTLYIIRTDCVVNTAAHGSSIVAC
jgi:hypothetical protein